MIRWLLLLLFAPALLAQQNTVRGQGVVYVTAASSGACSADYLEYVKGTGALWGCQAGTWTQLSSGGGGGGSVTSFSVTSVPSFLTSAVANASTTPALTLGLATGLTANQVLATPNGSAGSVGLRALVAADIPALSYVNTPTVTGIPKVTASSNTLGLAVPGVDYPSVASVQTIDVTATPYLASGSSFATTSTATASAAATSIAVTSAGDFITGQGMLIGVSGATPGTTTAVVTITSVVGLTINFTPALVTGSSYASGTNVQHDDSAAYNSAIVALGTTGGLIKFPTGFYRMNNCNATNSSVIVFPNNPLDSTYVATPLVAVQTMGTFEGGIVGGSSQLMPVIQTDCTSGSLITYPATITGAGFIAFNAMFKNIVFRAYTNPSVTMLNLAKFAQTRFEGVRFDTGPIPTTAPTHTTGIALINAGPFNVNENLVRDTYFGGYYEGLRAGAHTYLDNVWFWFDWYALTIDNHSAGGTDHPIFGTFVNIEQCKFLLSPLIGGAVAQNVYIMHLQAEQDSGGTTGINWMSPATGINDVNDYLTGEVNYESDAGGFTVTGGTNLQINPINFNGAATFRQIIGNNTGTVGQSMRNTNASGFNYLLFYDAANASAGALGYNNSSASNLPGEFQFGPTGSADDLVVTTGTTNVEHMRLTHGGHLGFSGTAPTVTACGSSPTLTNITDDAGTITIGSTGTGCTVTFATSYTTGPHCVVSPQASTLTYTESGSALVVTAAAATVFDYVCHGK